MCEGLKWWWDMVIHTKQKSHKGIRVSVHWLHKSFTSFLRFFRCGQPNFSTQTAPTQLSQNNPQFMGTKKKDVRPQKCIPQTIHTSKKDLHSKKLNNCYSWMTNRSLDFLAHVLHETIPTKNILAAKTLTSDHGQDHLFRTQTNQWPLPKRKIVTWYMHPPAMSQEAINFPKPLGHSAERLGSAQ